MQTGGSGELPAADIDGLCATVDTERGNNSGESTETEAYRKIRVDSAKLGPARSVHNEHNDATKTVDFIRVQSRAYRGTNDAAGRRAFHEN